MKHLVLCLCLFGATACSPDRVKVDDPFYLGHVGDEGSLSLIRCVSSHACAQDGLPGPNIIAAGANRDFVVVLQQTTRDSVYYYFKRVPQERRGWGNNPEIIIGPLSQDEFSKARTKLGLPDLTIRP